MTNSGIIRAQGQAGSAVFLDSSGPARVENHGYIDGWTGVAIDGNSNAEMALQLTGDPWAEDPACYLSNTEIGVEGALDRLAVTPFRGKSHDPAHRFF